MSKVKNISGGPLEVPLLDMRRVEAGEVVDVPDFQPSHSADNPLPIIWPPDKWEPVAEPKRRTAKTSATDDGSAG